MKQNKRILWRLSRALLFPAALAFVVSCSNRTPSLNLLVWEGYADPSFIKAFEEQNHCKISASYMGSSDELMAKLRGGSAGNYDVISPSSDVATQIATSGLAAPLDLSKIPSYSQLSAQLTSLPLVRTNGQTYGVPFMWGPDPIIYDTTRLRAAARFLERVLGPEISRAKFLCGTICRRSTWPRRFSVTTSPIRRNFTT